MSRALRRVERAGVETPTLCQSPLVTRFARRAQGFHERSSVYPGSRRCNNREDRSKTFRYGVQSERFGGAQSTT